LMLGITLLTLLLFQVLLGFPLAQPGLFVGISLVGGFSLSILYTFLSAISARAHQNAALMAILGFPLAAPLLSILSKLAIVAISPVYTTGWQSLLGILLALDVLIMLLSILLFPFLWEE